MIGFVLTFLWYIPIISRVLLRQRKRTVKDTFAEGKLRLIFIRETWREQKFQTPGTI